MGIFETLEEMKEKYSALDCHFFGSGSSWRIKNGATKKQASGISLHWYAELMPDRTLC